MGLIWVTARQQRAALPAALVLIPVYVAIVGPDESPLDAVRRYGVDPSQVAMFVLLSLGVFWAAPLLAREQQSGTIDLAYTQSISRARWLTARIAPPLLAAVVAPLVVLSLRAVIFPVPNTGGYHGSNFAAAPMFVGIELFAVALGLLAGAVLRRVVPAMIVAALGFYASESLVTPAAEKLIPMHPAHRHYTDAQLWGLQWLQLGLLAAVAAALVGGVYYWMTRRAPRS